MNANLTFRELKVVLDVMPEERLNDHVSIYHSQTDEFYELKEVKTCIDFNEADGVLDKGHYFLIDDSTWEN